MDQPIDVDVTGLVGLPPARHFASLLPAIAAQAVEADRVRSLDAGLVRALKASGALGISATPEIGGPGEAVGRIGWELANVAAACASTAWCLWNHLCVFHLYVGALGPDHAGLLRGIVEGHEWVCFPAGAGSRLFGTPDGDEVVLCGPTTFGSGCRYADWAGAAFALGDGSRAPTADELRFTISRLDAPGVSIEERWDGAALRATATDTVHYERARVPNDRCVPWYAANRAAQMRDPGLAMVHHRYREDWVGLSDLWLAAMAVGVLTAALADAVAATRHRKAIMGASMALFGSVQRNFGEVAAAASTARATVQRAADEVDERIAAGTTPTEADYQRQLAASTVALAQCDDAMRCLGLTLGASSLRQGDAFERHARDLAAMTLHINAHPDRVYTRLGQLLLGVPPQRF